MAFTVQLALPDLPAGNAVFRAWRVQTGIYNTWDTPIANVAVGEETYKLICNMPVVVEQTFVSAGDDITRGLIVAQVLAEGDEIPNGRPYARLELDA
jgi:hypothetical protein